MDKNNTKKYIFSLLLLIIIGYILSFIIFFAVSNDVSKAALFSVVSAFVPAGTYNGAVFFGKKLIEKERLDKKVIIAVCVFFPITLAFVTVSGIILIIPNLVTAFNTLKKDKG